MLSNLPVAALSLLFLPAAAGVWFAGIRLSEATDAPLTDHTAGTRDKIFDFDLRMLNAVGARCLEVQGSLKNV
jgi:hypothetical protein